MTIGTILYYGGFGVLGLAILLALIFALRRPRYTMPEKHSDTSPEGDQQSSSFPETQVLESESTDPSQDRTVLLEDPDRTMVLPPDR